MNSESESSAREARIEGRSGLGFVGLVLVFESKNGFAWSGSNRAATLDVEEVLGCLLVGLAFGLGFVVVVAVLRTLKKLSITTV